MPANAANRVIHHYLRHARRLPWRALPGEAAPDPYRVWLSEVMLQQTTVSAVTPEEADAYFATRARESQLGAWASDQSQPMASRADFEARYQALAGEYEAREVPRPPHWRGYRVAPERIEFWNDRAHRLHERRLFALEDGSWSEGLLYP